MKNLIQERQVKLPLQTKQFVNLLNITIHDVNLKEEPPMLANALGQPNDVKEKLERFASVTPH